MQIIKRDTVIFDITKRYGRFYTWVFNRVDPYFVAAGGVITAIALFVSIFFTYALTSVLFIAFISTLFSGKIHEVYSRYDNYIDLANIYLRMPKNKQKEYKRIMHEAWLKSPHADASYYNFDKEEEIFKFYAQETIEKADLVEEEWKRVREMKAIMGELNVKEG